MHLNPSVFVGIFVGWPLSLFVISSGLPSISLVFATLIGAITGSCLFAFIKGERIFYD